MDEGKTYVNVKFTKTGPQSLSGDGMGSERPARRDRLDSSILLICVLTAALIITGICWRIDVSQIRQPKITSDRNCREINSTLQSKIFPPGSLPENLSQQSSALNSNLSDLKRMHIYLRHQFTVMETKYRSVIQTKAEICELLTNRRVCSKNWIRNKARCYYVSTFETSFNTSMRECSNRDSRLLKINSSDEASFVSRKLVHRSRAYWIGKYENRNLGVGLLGSSMSLKISACRDCPSYRRSYPCDRDRCFICEKPATLFLGIPEQIKHLCQQPEEAT